MDTMYFVGYYVLHNTQLGLLILRTTMHTRPHIKIFTHTRTGLNSFIDTTHSLSFKCNFPFKYAVASFVLICTLKFCLCSAQDTARGLRKWKVFNLQSLRQKFMVNKSPHFKTMSYCLRICLWLFQILFNEAKQIKYVY